MSELSSSSIAAESADKQSKGLLADSVTKTQKEH